MNRFGTKSANTSITQRIMRIMFFLLLVGVGVSYAGETYPQSTKLNLNLKNRTIKEVFSEIEKNSEYIFFYNDANLDGTKKLSVNVNNRTIDKVLDEVFKDTDNTYYVSDRQIFVSRTKKDTAKKDKENAEQAPVQQITITGTVTDTEGEPLIGVTIKSKSKPTEGIVTDQDGKFSIGVRNMNETLLFTYVGMKSYELKLKAGTTNYKVVMESLDKELGAVVVEAGIIQRNKLGFTGSYHSMSQDELKSVGNMNIIQTLKTLDPAFVVMDNVIQGSNPNAMATIELRGKSGLNLTATQNENGVDPNTPLFVLDGFVVSLEEINDLDINRVESVTLLKDAGSTAIYGAKGANGVVVIETIKPKSGEVQITYNTDIQLAWADLSEYNLMNAKEKLEFERMANFFKNTNNPNNVTGADHYNRILRKISQGVDTYWLGMPVRTAMTHNQSLTVSGGNDVWMFTGGAKYRNTQGVMKGSSREAYDGNIRIVYRGVNNLNISNNLIVSGVKGSDGSWGSFDEFAKANPYYVPYDQYGSLLRYLDTPEYKEDNTSPTAANPLYNASLLSYADNKTFSVTNNTAMDWFIQSGLRLTGNLSLKRMFKDNYKFKDPRHTDFSSKDYTEKGQYTEAHEPTWKYNADVSLSYSKTLKDAHNLTFIGRTAIEEQNGSSSVFIAEGFPEGAEAVPSFAYSYKKNSRPSYSYTQKRAVSFLMAANYNYKYRYLFDLNINSEGATTFGRNNKFSQFWSVGTGWNIHKEKFAEDWKWVDELKLRGTYGTNANQGVNIRTSSVYGYYSGSDLFGTASRLDILGNPDLRWMVVKKAGIGINGVFLGSRLKFTFDVYRHYTDPMAIDITQKASTGVGYRSVNMGHMVTKGYEFMLSYFPVYDPKGRFFLNLRLTGSSNKSVYGGFNDALNALNNDYYNGKDATVMSMLQKFEDGNSPDDLWAVRSMGIDPATGKEVFLTKNGVPTFSFDATDRVKIANKNPKIQGIFGISLTYKKLQANISVRYQLGGYLFNNALYSKVENQNDKSLVYNQDKRALYDRWRNPGDIAQFKKVELGNNNYSTPMTSRFIQKSDMLRGESMKITWDFTKDKWLKTVGLKDLRAGIAMSEFFYLSTVKSERSTEYPFQRSLSFNISARF